MGDGSGGGGVMLFGWRIFSCPKKPILHQVNIGLLLFIASLVFVTNSVFMCEWNITRTSYDSGFGSTGKLIKRQRLPKNDRGDNWHWKDINNGVNVTFYGKVFRVINCDKFTSVSWSHMNVFMFCILICVLLMRVVFCFVIFV